MSSMPQALDGSIVAAPISIFRTIKIGLMEPIQWFTLGTRYVYAMYSVEIGLTSMVLSTLADRLVVENNTGFSGYHVR